MKRFLIIACAALFALAVSCTLQPVTPFVAADQAAETTLLAGSNTQEVSSANADTFNYTGGVPGALTADAGRVITLSFNNVVDSTSVAAGILVRRLATSTATTAYTQGAAVTYTPVVVPNGTNSQVVLTLDLNEATISSRLEVQLVSASLTAAGGKRLDADGDGIGGEVEDNVFRYITVSPSILQATVITPVAVGAGTDRNPSTLLAAVSGLLTVPAAAANTVTFVYANTIGTADNIGTATFAGLSLEKLVNGAWVAQTISVTYVAATFTATVTFPVAVVAGEIYRFTENRYNIVETAEVSGYVHRGNYNNDATNPTAPTRTLLRVAGAPALLGISSVDVYGQNYGYYVDVVFAGAGLGIQPATLTASTVKLGYMYESTSTGILTLENVAWTGSPIRLGPYTYRFLLPATFAKKAANGGGAPQGNTHEFYVSANNALVDEGASSTVATDNAVYGDITTAMQGPNAEAVQYDAF